MKNIIIWILIAFIVFMYFKPTEGQALINTGLDKLKSFVGMQVDKCTNEEAPVCSNNITYQNICKARLAGQFNVTMGECS